MKPKKNYDDIINLPRYVSAYHKPMSNYNRAAQFSPFAALTGYGEAIVETARITEDKIILGESSISELNLKFQILKENISNKPTVIIKYFEKDLTKKGGKYLIKEVVVKRIDEVERKLYTTDKQIILIDNIISVDGEIFEK